MRLSTLLSYVRGPLMFIVLRLLHISVTHKSNPSTLTQVYVDSYSTLLWVTW